MTIFADSGSVVEVVVSSANVVVVVEVVGAVVGRTVVGAADDAGTLEPAIGFDVPTVGLAFAGLLLHATADAARAEATTDRARRERIPRVCHRRARNGLLPRRPGARVAVGQRMRVSASWPPLTRRTTPSVTSTTVIEQLSRPRITKRSSPNAAPMTTLMATK